MTTEPRKRSSTPKQSGDRGNGRAYWKHWLPELPIILICGYAVIHWPLWFALALIAGFVVSFPDRHLAPKRRSLLRKLAFFSRRKTGTQT